MSEPEIIIIEVGIPGPPSPGSGGGDMTKAVYDIDNDGVVDEAEKIDGGVWT